MIIQIPKPNSEKGRRKFVFRKAHISDLIQGAYYEDAEWGIRIVTTDEPLAWVKDCRTGWPIPKSEANCLGKGKDGHYYWIRKGYRQISGNKTYPSVWAKNELP